MKRRLICIIHEVAKLDVEIASVLKKKPVVILKEDTTEFEKRKLGKIKKAYWSVVYQRRECDKVKKSLLFLLDKHLYSTIALNYIMDLTVACKANNEGDLKCFGDMIKWYTVIRNTLVSLMTKLFKSQKREKHGRISTPHLTQRGRLLGYLMRCVKFTMYVFSHN